VTQIQPSEIPRVAHTLPPDVQRTMYRDMLEQRRFEEAAGRAYGMGRIFGFCHLYIGQEAISTGTAHAMRRGPDGDIWVSAYRIHAQALALGVPAEAVMAELMGRATGTAQGLGGSMHIFDIERGFWGGWGLVGQQVPMAVGIAFAQRYQENGRVTLAFFGDGAIHQGAIHEAFNMASIWNIPVVFVCENNGFGMGTAVSRVSSLEPLHEMAHAYKIAHAPYDGMDVHASYDAMHWAIEHARSTSRPVFLEARCSRFRGHSMSDPGKYRTKEQLEAEKGADPIPRHGSWLVDQGMLKAEELEAIDAEVKAAMKAATAAAEAAPWPDPSLIDRYVYVDSPTA
jgi:pyruvate dehydrogenase E1 component alpha subunit